MTLLLVPAWQLPTVSTAVSPGATPRDTTVCSRTMTIAASTTGSMVFCGMEPWPPRPYTVMFMLSAADRHAPGAVAGLLGGLEQRDQGPVPLAAMTGQKLARPGQAGHMDVVTAGMRHR